MKKFLLLNLLCLAIVAGFVGCKAWRTYTTTATYTSGDDSTKVTTTITTKTTEEYTGIRKK
jgi:ABC-type glycerol-3-phosphate transport system substrate-binding protein